MKRKLSILLFIIIILGSILIVRETAKAPDGNLKETPKAVQFDKKKYSIDDPGSIWVIVNKKRPLREGYAPLDLSGNLRTEAASNYNSLAAEAQKAGHPLKNISGYRTQSYQAETYDNYARKDGMAEADKYSARARHSEHQTGLAVDVGEPSGNCELEDCFGDTPTGKWLAANAHKHGFIIRYQKGKEHITGYQYEPWHLRYVGKELATELSRTGLTMEEFFGVSGGDYQR